MQRLCVNNDLMINGITYKHTTSIALASCTGTPIQIAELTKLSTTLTNNRAVCSLGYTLEPSGRSTKQKK